MRTNKKWILVGMIILMIAWLGGHLFAIAPVIPTFPVASLVNTNTCPYSAGYGESGASTLNGTYVYSIFYTPAANNQCMLTYYYNGGGGGASEAINVYLPVNYSSTSEINLAISENNQQISSLDSSINSLVSTYSKCTSGVPTLNYTNWQSYVGTCINSGFEGGTANNAYSLAQLVSLLQQTNSYINSHEITQTQSMAPPATPAPTATQTSFFGSISTEIQSFLSAVFANFKAWFALPSNIFSVGISGSNFTTAANTTYVNKTITINIAIALNKTQLTVPWVSGTSFVQDTFCGSFVYYNNTKTFIYESNLINMTTANYNNTINFKPTQIGVYVAGVSCQTTNATFSNGAWSAWSTPKVILLQQKPFAVIPQTTSITPPTSTITITNTSFFSSIATAIQSFINSIITFFKSL